METIKTLFWICFILVFYTYIGYGILMWILVKLKERKNKGKDEEVYSDDDLQEVTLLVAAYNEEAVIDAKMENTYSLKYPKEKLHLVWVTDGSNDKTNELLSQYKDVEVLFEPERKGKTSAINRAMTYVSTPIVIMTDANTMLNEEAIVEMVKPFKDKTIGCVAGEKRIMTKTRSGVAAGGEGMYWKYESTLKDLDARLYSAMGAAGELFALRTDLFEKMESDTLLDDFVLSMRIVLKGYRIAYTKKAFAIESGSKDMREEEKRKVRIAAGGMQSIIRLKALLNPLKYGIVTFEYISHRVLRWSITPIAFFLMFPLNLFLAFAITNGGEAIFYLLLMMGQMLFYLLGYWGYVLSRLRIKSPKLYIVYYFLFMNINVIKGFFYLSRHHSGVWEQSQRA